MAVSDGNGALDSGEVAVPRTALVELRTLIIGVVVGALVLGGAGIYFAVSQEGTNEHLGETDRVLVEFIQAELAEEERESAGFCRDAHVRYGLFEDLAAGLTAAGGRVGAQAHVNLLGAPAGMTHEDIEAEIGRLLPDEIAPLLERYPPPECDLEAAEAVLAEDPPRPPDIEGLIDR